MVSSSVQEGPVVYPSLPSEITPRKRKSRPTSLDVERDLPRKLQCPENDTKWREGSRDARSKLGPLSHKGAPSYIIDLTLEENSADDKDTRNGGYHRSTVDAVISSDSGSDDGSEASVSGESVLDIEQIKVENAFQKAPFLSNQKKMPLINLVAGPKSRHTAQTTCSPQQALSDTNQVHRPRPETLGISNISKQTSHHCHCSTPRAHTPNQSQTSCTNSALGCGGIGRNETDYEHLGRLIYPSLPRQKNSNELDTAADFVPFASFDNNGASAETFARPSPPPLPPTEPELCEEQARLVNLIVSGKNVFYTGSAGCGKSTVLKAFVKRLTEIGKRVKIIAPTGRAAVDIDGTTFWSFAGWVPESMKKPAIKLAEGARNFKWVNQRLCEVDVLVIDEISMMENHHFERLNLAMKSARNNIEEFGALKAKANASAPFGGVQLVVTGDFCQLPPVLPFQYCLHCGLTLRASEDGEIFTCVDKKHGPYRDIDKWAFRSAAWKKCRFKYVNLTHIHRQSDAEFIKILQKMRFGRPLSQRDRLLLLNHESDTTNAVKLFPLLWQVRQVNGEEFARLKGPTISFNCLDSYHWNKDHANLIHHFSRSVSDETLDCQNKHQFEPQVNLKSQMLVILLVNLDISLGLINGSQGVVLGFLDHDPAQIPEQVGSRAELKKTQITEFVDRAESKKWPLVQFRNGARTFTRLIKPYCVVNELGESTPYSWVSRTQLPLLPAWAISVHKSQGMTLSRVEVNLSKSFEKGLSYVALSRATSLAGLKVHALDNGNPGGNRQVMEFLREKFGNDVVDGVDA